MIKYLLIILTLCSCYSLPIAQKQFGRAVATYDTIGSNYCATTYPVRTKTDSAGYLKSIKQIDSLEKELNESERLSEEERIKLLEEIARIKESIPKPETTEDFACDSLNEALYRLSAKDKQRIISLEASNKKLIEAAKNVKPIRDTVGNTAALKSCESERKSETGRANKQTELKEGFQKDRNKWRLIAIGLGALIGLWLFFFIRKRVKR